MKDLMGQAIWDYYHYDNPQDMLTETTISTMDVFRTAYLFRKYKDMPSIEKKAMELAKGKVLDVGAGAGSHSLYLQEKKKLDVTALDYSPKSIEICRLRGIKNTVCAEFLDYSGETFDTILLLMNGTGIFKKFMQTGKYLKKLKSLLNPGGQILIDSSDIIYMYNEERGNPLPGDHYYGEVMYYLFYKGEKETPFPWLYLDYLSLKEEADDAGFETENILDEGFSYLARLTDKNPN